MINSIVNYINEKEFRFTVFLDRVHIVNYQEILSLEDNRIRIAYYGGTFVIKGTNLCVNRLLDQEILIVGQVLEIEMNPHDQK